MFLHQRRVLQAREDTHGLFSKAEMCFLGPAIGFNAGDMLSIVYRVILDMFFVCLVILDMLLSVCHVLLDIFSTHKIEEGKCVVGGGGYVCACVGVVNI